MTLACSALATGHWPLTALFMPCSQQYGAIPRAVFEAHQALAERSHFNYDKWNGEMIGGGFLESRTLIAEAIAADVDDVVMVENASVGMNAALRCLEPPLKRGDKVIYLSTEYGMTHSVLNFLEASVGVELVMVAMEPTEYRSDDAVMSAVEAAIAEHGGAEAFAMGVISHISSQPAVVLPVARFTAALQSVPVVVDGAHAPGTIPLDVPSLGAMAYTGNLHKWYYTPKGCGFLWASPEFQKRVQPTVLSSESGGDYSRDPETAAVGKAFAERRGFTYVGTRDYTNWAAVPAAFEFRRQLPGGEEACMEYGAALAVWSGRRLAELWGTEVMAMSESDPACWIATIRVPEFDSAEQAGYVRGKLASEFRTNASWTEWGGQTWQRLSAQVYLDRATILDYGQRVLDLREEHRRLVENEEAAAAVVEAEGAEDARARL